MLLFTTREGFRRVRNTLRSLALVVLVALPASAGSQTVDEVQRHDHPSGSFRNLARVDLNLDEIPDTIQGYLDTRLRLVPVQIAWGRGSHDAGVPTPTVFRYPEWKRLRLSLATGRFSVDEEEGAIIYISGRDALTERDTTRGILLPAQRGFERVQTIDFGVAAGNACCRVIELLPDRDLVDRAQRDLSRRPSFRLLKVPDPGPGAGVPPGGDTVAHRRPHISIYPNPSAEEATLRLDQLNPGNYSVEVVSIEGRRHHRQEVRVESGGDLLQKIDLAGLAAGNYLVHITTNQGSIGSCNITITR